MAVTDKTCEQRSCLRVVCLGEEERLTAPSNRLTLCDFSDGGVCFEAAKPVTTPTLALELVLPGMRSALHLASRLAWKRHLNGGGMRYGAVFVDLEDKLKELLRTEIVKAHTAGLLNDIKDKDTRSGVADFFLKDLSAYITVMEGLQAEATGHDGYSVIIQEQVERLNTTILLKGYSLSLLLNDIGLMRRVKDAFRALAGPWAYKSRLMKQAADRVHACPGDFHVLEMIYQNQPVSQGLGEYFDRYFLNNPDAVALRARKGRVRDMLKRYILNHPPQAELRVLSVACGCCREIAELVGEMQYPYPLTLTCMDWDDAALDFAREHLGSVPSNIIVEFERENLMDACQDARHGKPLPAYDLIYSVGLADYLPDATLNECLAYFRQMLPENGELILTHKNPEKTFPGLTAEWFCDWESIPRGKAQLADLMRRALPGFKVDIAADDFGYIYYLSMTKHDAHPNGNEGNDSRPWPPYQK